jgi:carboxylate-amine ligase
VEWIRPSLEASGDLEVVVEGLERIRRDGTGAARQRERYAKAGGVGLREMYAEACDGPVRTAPVPSSIDEVAVLVSSPFPPAARRGSVAS